MDINATLLGQMLTFAVLVWFTMKYVWPPVTQAMAERQKRIAEGLDAAERGVHELELAQHKAAEKLRDAKIQAAEILDKANKRAALIVEDAKNQARDEGSRLLVMAQEQIQQEIQQAQQQLREQVAALAIAGAERILQQHLDSAANQELVDNMIGQL